MDPVVFVHLSDIHFTSGDGGLEARRGAVRVDVLNDLRMMREEIGDATAVLATGDIAFAARPEEYALATQWLDRVAEVVGSDRAQVLTVPGNHDVDRSTVGPLIELAHDRLRNCPDDRLDAELEGLLQDPQRPLLRPLLNYNTFAMGYGCAVPENGRAWTVPHMLSPEYTLAVHGLTSVFNSDRNDPDGKLVIGRTQTTLPAKPGVVYMLLMHHGPDDCRDPVGFRDRVKGRAALLLSGHRHDQRVRETDGRVELNAGAVHPEEQFGYHPTYNWIRMTVRDDGTGAYLSVEVWQREMRPEWNEFRSGTGSNGCQTFKIPLPPARRAHPRRGAGAKRTAATGTGRCECAGPRLPARR